MDMIRTAVNVSGDAVVSSIVSKSEGKLDLSIYNDPNAGIYDEDEEMHIDDAVEAEMQEAVNSMHDK
jgi:Na+/H+-dicarboxylate symporter